MTRTKNVTGEILMTFLDIVCVCFFMSFPSVVTYRANDQSTPPNELLDGDSSSESSLSNPIRTRTYFPETWLWQNLLVNGYTPPTFYLTIFLLFLFYFSAVMDGMVKESTNSFFAKERMTCLNCICLCVLNVILNY